MEKQKDDKPLYNSRILQNYIKLIRRRYSHIDVNTLLRHAGIEPWQADDEGHWFTQEQMNKFHRRLRELTGNVEIAREAGRYCASPEAIGGIKQYILGLVSPSTAYMVCGKVSEKFTRSSSYTSQKIGPNKIELKVTPREGVKEEPFQCENRMGYMEAITKTFNYKLPRIEHPECLFKGDQSCRYIISWQKSPAALLKKIWNIALPVLAVVNLWLFSVHGMGISVILPGSLAFIALLGWLAEIQDNKELRAAVNSLSTSSENLVEQINMNYNNALMVNEIGQILNGEPDIDGVLDNIPNIIKKRLDYDRALVMLANPDKSRLVFKSGYGYTEEQLAILQKILFRLDNPESKGIFVISFNTRKPFLLNDIDEIKDQLTPRSYEFAQKMGVKSLICCPIVYEEEALGILAVDNLISKRPLLQRDINLLMGVASQIGSRLHNVKIEAQLRQTQKMKAVGSLAGGVAHDFNNILTTILGYSQLISKQLPEDHPAWEKIQAIQQAGERAANLTRQLLVFSRKQIVEMKVVNLNEIVENMNKMLGRLIGEDIQMELRPMESIGNIMADVGQIEQILMNLAVNARDAMPNGGRLIIETSETDIDKRYARDHGAMKSGPHAMLTVTDTGRGMSREVRERIFEPFFTTKERDKGTGLGLATVYGIIKQHSGHIYVYSEPDKGTTFRIYFPVVNKEVEGTNIIAEEKELPRGTETIMIVDDDPSVNSLASDTLAPLGYKLIKATNGLEALEISRTTPENIDLVLSDVIMPGMNGRELVETIAAERPGIKTILMSGYTDNIVAHHGVLEPGIIFINKPLLPVALANKIRNVLDGPE